MSAPHSGHCRYSRLVAVFSGASALILDAPANAQVPIGMDALSVDTDTVGNAQSTIGSIEPCIGNVAPGIFNHH